MSCLSLRRPGSRYHRGMQNLIGPRIQKLRRACGLRQSELARHLGVTTSALSHWETGRRPFPEERLDVVAAFLGVEPDTLLSASDRSERSAGRTPRLRPPYPPGATVDDVSALGGQARLAISRAREQLTPGAWKMLSDEFPRDTREELLVALSLCQSDATVVLASPAQWGCPLHVMDDLDASVGDHLLQPAIVRRTHKDTLVVFGQVCLNVLGFGAIRTDFLVFYQPAHRPGYFVLLEIDDRTSHEKKRLRDKERDQALPVPTLRYENGYVFKPWFASELLNDLRALAPVVKRLGRKRRQRARERQRDREAWATERRAKYRQADGALGFP